MDETWIHHFTPESNRQSAEWTAAGERRQKQLKMQMSAGKVLVSVFGDVQGILFSNYLEKGRTINSEYCIALMVHLKVKKKKKKKKKKKSAKTATNEEEKKSSFIKTMHHITSQSQ